MLRVASDLAVVHFTCWRDLSLLTVAAESVASRLGSAAIHFAIDEMDPLRDHLRDPILTRASRGATLDGIDWILEEIDTFLEVLRRTPTAQWVLKMDSDVVMLNTRWLRELRFCKFIGARADKKVVRSAYPNSPTITYPFAPGMVYLLSRDLILKLADLGKSGIRDILSQADQFTHGALSYNRPLAPGQTLNYPEDECLFWLIRAVEPDWRFSALLCRMEEPKGFLHRWNYEHAGHLPSEAQAQALRQSFDFVDCGRTAPLSNQYPNREDRLNVALEVMKTLTEPKQ